MTSDIPLLSTQGYETLWHISNEDPGAFYEKPQVSKLRELMEQHAISKGEDPQTLWAGTIAIKADLQPLNEADDQNDRTDAANAPVIKAAFPELVAEKAADHRIWASINCFALLPYTTIRWNHSNSAKAPIRTDDEQRIREWVQEHYLGHGTDMKQNNAAARLWWLVEMARRAAQHSEHTPERLLAAMANDVEMYHQLLFRPYLASNPRITASIYDTALKPGNDYLFRRPYPNRMLQALNIRAAARSLGALSDATLRQVVEEAKPPKGTKATS